ncbi:hypothetical protein REPUB_Repub09cG0155500 [Reevesia pubescens]
MDLLPDQFEAEERSVYETPEVLHLVSGRDLFGMVCLVDRVPELSFTYNEKLTSSMSVASIMSQSTQNARIYTNDEKQNFGGISQILDRKVGSGVLLGTISGLGTSPEEGSCFVYNSSGSQTHVIMKHRTLLVKHMHWYRVGEEVSVCECRCSRARLPPSKFWLFERRCGMHDIGGWYIETFGRDKKGRTVPSQRFWDGFDANEQFDERLHPAIYLLALAYRTLDIEDAKIRKQTIWDIVERKLFKILNLCKKLV